MLAKDSRVGANVVEKLVRTAFAPIAALLVELVMIIGHLVVEEAVCDVSDLAVSCADSEILEFLHAA